MAALAGTAVVLTLGVMLMPTYARVRSALARAHGERLVYLAKRFPEANLLPQDDIARHSG